jgi:hypothetical protein
MARDPFLRIRHGAKFALRGSGLVAVVTDHRLVSDGLGFEVLLSDTQGQTYWITVDDLRDWWVSVPK